MLLAWNEKKKSYVYVFSWIKSLKVMLPRMCICLGFCDFTSWHHSCYDDDVSSNRKQTMHSHAPIEASIRNPSRRLMQTVSSNPPSNPQWSMKQLRGLQLHKLRFMHLSIISVYISNFIFHFFFYYYYYWLLLQPLFVDNRRQVFSLVCSALLPSGGQVLLALKKASIPERINTSTFNYLKCRWNLRSSNVHIPQNLPTHSYGEKPYDVLTCDRCQCALFHSICTDLSSASEEMSLFPSNLKLCQHVLIE